MATEVAVPVGVPGEKPLEKISFKGGISTSAFHGKVGAKIRALDKDGNGYLDAAELTMAIDELLKSESDKKLLRWILIAIAVLACVLVGILTGMTYGIIQLTKDVQVNSGTLNDRETGEPVKVASKWHGDLKFENINYKISDPANPSAGEEYYYDFDYLKSLTEVTLVGPRGNLSVNVLAVVRTTLNDNTTFVTPLGSMVVRGSTSVDIIERAGASGLKEMFINIGFVTWPVLLPPPGAQRRRMELEYAAAIAAGLPRKLLQTPPPFGGASGSGTSPPPPPPSCGIWC